MLAGFQVTEHLQVHKSNELFEIDRQAISEFFVELHKKDLPFSDN